MSNKDKKTSQDSSEAEQSLRKGKAVGSTPTLGSRRDRVNDMKKRYSRRAKVETSRNIKKTIIYLLITLLAVLAVFFFGINFLIRYAGFFMDIDSSDTPIEVQDTTPPPPPRLRNYEDVTNEEELEVRGNTEAGAKVKILYNNREGEVLANNEGEFTFSFDLNEGKNQFSAYAIDSSGNESAKSETVTVTYDKEPPDLEVTTPEDGQEFFGDENRQISIEGQTESNAQVTINGRWAVVDNNGKFAYSHSLEEGENTFEIIAKDDAGNETTEELTVNFTP